LRPLLHCVSKAKGQELLLEIYAGVYRGHIGARALVAKVLRQGFYWPGIIDEKKIGINMQSLSEIFSPLEGPSPAFVVNSPILASSAMGHQHKWVEAKPITNISSMTIKKFF
jgi:hypothetical protein